MATSKIITQELYLIPFTTTQRDALTPMEGDTIYNLDTEQIEFFNGTTWVGGGIPEPTTDGKWVRQKSGTTYTWEHESGGTILDITWADLMTTATATHKVGQVYKLTDNTDGDTAKKDYQITINMQSPDGSFWFDVVDNNGVITTYKTV